MSKHLSFSLKSSKNVLTLSSHTIATVGISREYATIWLCNLNEINDLYLEIIFTNSYGLFVIDAIYTFLSYLLFFMSFKHLQASL